MKTVRWWTTALRKRTKSYTENSGDVLEREVSEIVFGARGTGTLATANQYEVKIRDTYPNGVTSRIEIREGDVTGNVCGGGEFSIDRSELTSSPSLSLAWSGAHKVKLLRLWATGVDVRAFLRCRRWTCAKSRNIEHGLHRFFCAATLVCWQQSKAPRLGPIGSKRASGHRREATE